MNHVLVDYENVQEIDLPADRDIALSLVLLVGEKQKQLKTDLVEQLLPRAAQVQLIRMTASGKNALDFALAYHLGRAVTTDPTGYFHIVSKDKGFDALVSQLKSRDFASGVTTPSATFLSSVCPSRQRMAQRPRATRMRSASRISGRIRPTDRKH